MKWIFFPGSLGLLPALFRFVWSPWGQHNEGLRRFPCREFVTLSRIDFLPSLSVSTKSERNWPSFISTNRHSHDIFLNNSLQDSYLVDHFPHVLLKEFAWWEMNSEKWQSFFILIFSLAFHSLGIKLMDFKGSDSDLLLCV